MIHYYVNGDTGDNGNDGSELTPWGTLSYALSTDSGVAPGDTVELRQSTFTEFITVGIGGTVGAPITVKAYDGETPTLEGLAGTEGIMEIPPGINYLTIGDDMYFSYGHAKPNGVKRFPWITVRGTTGKPTTNIILQNFNLERTGWNSGLDVLATSTWDEFGLMIDNANNVTVNGAWIRGVSQGIALRNQCFDATIENNDIQYTVQSNITLGTSQSVNRRAYIGSNLLGFSAKEDGIQFMPDYDAADVTADFSDWGTILAYNVINDCGENGIDLKGAYNILIHGNILYGIVGSNDGYVSLNRNAMGAITRGSSTTSSRVIIRFNIIYDSSGGCRLLEDWKVYNNTFVYNVRDYTGPGSSFMGNAAAFTGVRQNESSTGGGVRNNIFSGHTQGNVALKAGTNQPNNEVDSDFNLYATSKWVDKTPSTSVTYTTLASWRDKLNSNNWRFGKDANSILVPNHDAIQFVNVPANPTLSHDNYDFNIKSSSPAKYAGGWVTLANGNGTASTTLTVDDSKWFSTVFDRTDKIGRDRVFINGQERQVLDIDDSLNQLELDLAATWSDNDPVYPVGQGFTATATPDIGSGGFLSQSGGGGTPPSEPPASGTGGRSIVRVACATGGGNQTITLTTSLPDTPVAWKFTVITATADETAANGMAIGTGWAWDNGGTIVEGAIGIRSKHNNANSDTSRRTITDGCVMILDSTSSAIDGQASFDSATTDEVVINWTNAPAAGYELIVEAFSGVDVYFGQFDVQQTQDDAATISCGFAAQWVEVATVGKAIPSNNAGVKFSYGIGTIVSTTPTQQCLIWQARDNVTTDVAALLSNADIGAVLTDTASSLTSTLQIENVTSTAFDIATKTGDWPDATTDAFVFVLGFTDLSVYSGVVVMPTSTGNTNHAVGFTAGQACIIATNLTALNTIDTTTGVTFAYGAWDGVSQYSAAIADEDNVSTSNTQTLSDDKFLNLTDDTGGALAAMTVSASGSNLVGNYSAVDATARYMILAAIEEVVVASVTADFHADSTSGAATLTVNFTDDSTEDGTTITDWTWDFGDGGSSTSQNPSHDYDTEGSYTVILTVSDGTVSSSKTRTEYIVVSAAPPAENYPSPTGTRTLVSAQMPTVARSDVQVSASVG